MALARITGSIGRTVQETLRRVRARRERLVCLVVAALRTWRGEGTRAVLRKTAGILSGEQRQSPQGLRLVCEERGREVPIPAFSVVLDTSVSDDVSEAQTVEWVTAQTYREAEVAVWDRAAGRARVTRGDRDWSAESMEELCRQLRGRYICLASSDLLAQNRGYLAANLVALETERLALTINVQGDSSRASARVAAGLLPGSARRPLLRQIVRKECLRRDYVVDVSEWVRGRGSAPIVVGKVIGHTTERPEPEGAVPFGTALRGAKVAVDGPRVVAWRTRKGKIGVVAHTLYPVRSGPSRGAPSRPRVLVVLPFIAVGGAERLVLDTMRHLSSRVDFAVVALEGHPRALGTLVDTFRQVTPNVYTVADFLASELMFPFMGELIERFDPRTLYIANGSTWIYDALGTLKSRFPTLRIVNQVYDHRVGWINRCDASLAQQVDAHIGPNRKICEAYAERGVQRDRVHHVEHGVDTDVFDPGLYPAEKRDEIRRKLGLPEAGALLTFIGRLHPQKRPMDFVELAKRFEGDHAVTCVMIGDGPMRDAIEAEARRTRIANLVRHSFYTPSSEIFAVADVVVAPSEYEGMPLVVLEAQAMGKAVVATDVGANREVLEYTRGGWIVPRVGDVGALAAAVEDALARPPDGATVREAVVRRFGIRRMIEQYERVLLGETCG